MGDKPVVQSIWNAHVEQRMRDGWVGTQDRNEFSISPPEAQQQFVMQATVAERRPDYNGSRLINPPGTIWTVVDGFARGWISGALFDRVHVRRRYWCYGNNPRVCGVTAMPLTAVQSVAWIAEGPPWNDDVGLVRNRAGTVCLYETPRGEDQGVLYALPSARVMDHYWFDWDKVRLIPEDEFNSYPVRVVLTMPDGST